MSTIYQVAELAGVSPATVSRVFNGVAVNPQYAERVRVAAAELHFVPNRTARRLRSRSSEVIALIIPDFENPFFTSLARGVEDRAQEAGLSLVLCDSDERADKESTYLDVVRAEHMAGVILVPATDHPALDRLLAARTPVVAVDRGARHHPVDAVVLDNEEVGWEATEMLYRRGFRRVGCITGPADTETAELRAAGWRRAFAARHRRVSPDRYVRHADFRPGGGKDAMAALLRLRTPPDAVVVANNVMAVGALEVLAERGLSPTDLGMACVGDLPYSMLQRSGVLVLPLPARALGRAAADRLLARIAGDSSAPKRIVVTSPGAGSTMALT